ncbi:MAG: LEA type 2 family protein [Haloarculaceae archaeon]
MDESDSRGLLALSPVRALAAVLIALAVVGLLVGTASATGVLGVPSVVDVDNHFAGANASATVVSSNLTVTNPNPIPLSLAGADVSHAVYMNGIRMGSGSRTGLYLPSDNSTVRVRTTLRNDRIPRWWVTHVRNGEHTNLTVRGTVTSTVLDRSVSRRIAHRSIDTNVISVFETNRTVPVNASVPGVSNPVLYVNRTRAHWGTVTRNRTVVRANLTVTNPHSYAVPIDNVTYGVTMNGVEVGNGSTRNLSAIPPKTTTNVSARFVVDNRKLDDWWVTHVRNDQTTTARFDYAVRVDLSQFGRGSRTFSPPPIERTFHTDIFGEDSAGNGVSVS